MFQHRLANCHRCSALTARAHGLAGHLAPRCHRARAEPRLHVQAETDAGLAGGKYGHASYNLAAFGVQYFEDAAEGAAWAIHTANDGTVVLHDQNSDGALPFYCQSGTHGGMALRAAACPVSEPDRPQHRSYSWNQSLNKVCDHFVRHYTNMTLAPRQPAGRHLPQHQQLLALSPGSARASCAQQG